MELLNLPSLLTIKSPDGGEQPTSLAEYLRRIIIANTVATYMSHKANMYGEAASGAIRVRIPAILQTAHYKAFGGNITQQMEMSNVVVPIDQMEMIKTQIEKFDMVRFQNSGAYQAEILAMIAKTIIVKLNFNYYKIAMETLAANKQNTTKLDFGKIANTMEEMAEFKLTSYKYVQFINQAKKIFSRINYSLETTDINTALNSVGANNIAYGFTTGSAGDKAIDIQIQGSSITGKQLGGLNYILDEGVIDNIHPTGSGVSLDDEFDFSNITAISIYAGAIAFATTVQSLVATYDPDTLNAIIGSKFMWGGKAVLPQFIWGAVKDQTGMTTNLVGSKLNIVGNLINPKTLKVVATPTNLPLSEMGTISVSSSDEEVATATYANGLITITKVKNGTSNITIQSNHKDVRSSTSKITFVDTK